ncbi:hypothetical protein IFR04_004061 [Cadophora malorum]|uniref:2EXR domain-containing protein n=1 Tax=Cadophora malorum TaxID=108018 RepID=A0A8H7WDJ4_9HELO|nr:hypothetical protein IFR04_004061 [Cadophora malorum]
MSLQLLTGELGKLSLIKQCANNPPDTSCFSDLPTELKDSIWEYALPGTRIISIRNGHHVISIPYCIAMNTIESTLSAMLQTCRESRSFVLARYQHCFKANLCRPILFSGDKDILHFHTLQAMDEFFTGSKEPIREYITKVRTVAVGTPPSMRQPNANWAHYFKPETMIPMAWTRFGELNENIMLQPSFSEEIYRQTVADLKKKPKMLITMDRFHRFRDRYVIARRQITRTSDADEEIDVRLTTEAFGKFSGRAT